VSQFVFDEHAAAQLEVMYRSRDVRRRRRLVREALAVEAGHRVLDVGCGPGFYAAELLAEVGASGAVVGVDSSAAMLAAAARRCEGLGDAIFQEGSATTLSFEGQSFDRALCVQVLEYVADVPAALAQFHRVLRPGGRVVIWDVDWSTLSWHSADPVRMERVLRAWDRQTAHPTLPRKLAAALRAAGFAEILTEGHAFVTTALDPETFGGLALQRVEQYIAGGDEIPRAEAAAWAEEQRDLGARGEYFFAITQFCFTAVRPK
jgi:ubiquinone/menaquinone biosynthesis C-methylase UbiE